MEGRPARPHVGPRRGRFAVAALGVVLALLATFAALRETGPGAPTAAPRVHAERAGLRLGTEALTGRVSLVASAPGLRWRIAGLTPWREAAGRVLVRGWDTTGVADGRYLLELRATGVRATWALSVRNSTPLEGSPVANASAGLDASQDDAGTVVAAFARRSYRPGTEALLRLGRSYPGVRVELLRVGAGRERTVGDRTLTGVRVGSGVRVRGGARAVPIVLGRWPSGLYAAKLSWQGRVGFAPFVLRPRRLGESRVAVVQPTNTWQAYNYRCANGDGRPDTWYYEASCTTVDTSRPYLDRGVPPHFRAYDLGFLQWLERRGERVDMLAQEDLELLSGERLARLYRLVVFPGHHEYVTTAEYDAVQRFRDLGGNLAFLSANNFFYRVDRRGDRLTRIGRWRDLGRPEAALVGVQYFQWNLARYPSRRYTVVGAHRAPWLFARTGLRNGAQLGWWGIEVDGRAPASPRSVQVLAAMPNAFGMGRPAEMTYYETSHGARVFAAGAFTLGGTQARRWTTSILLENLWARLAGRPLDPRAAA